MSITLVSDVMRCGPIFKNGEKAALLVFANYADEEGFSRPSVPQAAWDSGISKRQIQNISTDLHDLGIMDIVERGGGRRSNRYRLNVGWLHAAAAEIMRVKQKAIEDGVRDRYAVMAGRAAEIRAELVKRMMADEARCKSWLKRHPLRAEGPKNGPDGPAKKISPKAKFHPSGEIFRSSGATIAPLGCKASAGDPSVESKPDPSVDRFQSAGDAREPPAPTQRQELQAVQNSKGEGKATDPPEPGNVEALQDRIRQSANRLRASPHRRAAPNGATAPRGGPEPSHTAAVRPSSALLANPLCQAARAASGASPPRRAVTGRGP
jgi:hypothetical protein